MEWQSREESSVISAQKEQNTLKNANSTVKHSLIRQKPEVKTTCEGVQYWDWTTLGRLRLTHKFGTFRVCGLLIPVHGRRVRVKRWSLSFACDTIPHPYRRNKQSIHTRYQQDSKFQWGNRKTKWNGATKQVSDGEMCAGQPTSNSSWKLSWRFWAFSSIT